MDQSLFFRLLFHKHIEYYSDKVYKCIFMISLSRLYMNLIKLELQPVNIKIATFNCMVYHRMSTFSPELLLANVSKERCIAKLKQLPELTFENVKCSQIAAVLVPLCIVDSELCLLYTLRSLDLKAHSGQVSFPGGKSDPGETPYQTALRETEEEVGINRDNIDIWSEMSGVQGRNKSLLIVPVVGVIKDFDVKRLKPNVKEVEEIFTVPLKDLCDPENHGHMLFQDVPIPVYKYKQHIVWGITGMITHLFLQNFIPSSLYDIGFLNRKFNIEDLERSRL